MAIGKRVIKKELQNYNHILLTHTMTSVVGI